MDDTPTPIPTALNVAELASRHGVSKRTIQRRIKRGEPLDMPKRGDKRAKRDSSPVVARHLADAPLSPTTRAKLARQAGKIAATAFCVAPAAALNIWPRAHDMIAGQVDAKAVGLVALQTVSVVIMARAPFSFDRASTGKWTRVAPIGALCLAMNFSLATEGVGSIRDAISVARQATIATHDRLAAHLERKTIERAALPAFKPTTQSGILAAQSAVYKECAKVGPHCRERQDDLREAEANKAKADKADKLDLELIDIRAQLDKLGAVPDKVDPAATRLASLLHLNPETVSTYWPMALALVAELIAMLGPYLLCL